VVADPLERKRGRKQEMQRMNELKTGLFDRVCIAWDYQVSGYFHGDVHGILQFAEIGLGPRPFSLLNAGRPP